MGLCVALTAAACSSSGPNDGSGFVSRSGESVLGTGTRTAETPETTASSGEAPAVVATDDPELATTRSNGSSPLGEGAGVCTSVAVQGQPLADLTASSGIDEALVGIRGHAAAAGDVNADGHADLFVGGFADRSIESYQVRGASGPAPDRLLLGSTDGFTIDPTFPEIFGRSSGAAFADLDGDGDLDLVVARNPRDEPRGQAPSEVLENDNGTFRPAVVLDESRGLRSIGVLDFDGDGLLDLFLVEDRFSGGDSVLLRNEGGFVFTDATASAGLPSGLAGLGVAAVDVDRSGTPDIFVAGDNRLFVNDAGRFTEVIGPFEWQVFSDEDDVAGVAAGDVNGDGWMDLVVGQHYNSTLDSGIAVPVRLYINQGLDGSGLPMFEDVTEAAGLVGLPTKAPHVELVDLDGDGRLDILTSASGQGGAVPAMMLNQGGEVPQFSAPPDLGSPQYWVAGAVIDVDGDPAPEIFMVEWEPAIGSRLFDNPAVSGSFVSVQVGDTGAAGVGAIVEVRPAGSDGLIAAVPIVASTGYGSGAEPVARAGVGGNSSVDVSIRLGWTDDVIEIGGVAAGSAVIVESDGSWRCRS